MPLTPQQIAKIRQKEAATPDALKRNPLNNYTEGWFHVTLNVRSDAPILGYITGNAATATAVATPSGNPNAAASNAPTAAAAPGGPNAAAAAPGGPDVPRCVLTPLGKKVEECWKGVDAYYPEIETDEFIVMPEHVHGLIHLKATNKVHLGQIIRGFMIGCTHAYWDTLGLAWGDAELKKDSGKPQTLTDRDHTRSFRGPALFVRGYNDVEAIDEEEIDIKRQYIRNNPRKRLITRDRPDCFCVRRNMRSANWTPERIMQGLCADLYIAADRNKQIEAWQQVTVRGARNSRGKVSATLNFQALPANRHTAQQAMAHPTATAQQATAQPTATAQQATAHPTAAQQQAPAAPQQPVLQPVLQLPVLDLVGNIQLLRRPLFPLVCHRADAPHFEQQKAAVLKAAREQGGVIVTACVSPKERDIIKLLQQELLPVVVVMDGGFSDRYRPLGKAFYAVAEGRRLEVSPWLYEYHRREMRPIKDAWGNIVLDADGRPLLEEVPDISREMCMVMNELVRVISGRADDWWKATPPQ